jgi:glycosyltransferase involved in cell wall biosynthesis
MRHICLGISFKRLYPTWLFPGKGQMELGDLPAGGAPGDPILHYADPFSWRRALQGIDSFSPDAVLLTWWVPFWAPHLGLLARKLAKKYRVIYLCHNVLPHEKHFYEPECLIRWALKPADGFIVHSEENKRQLSRWFPQSRVIRREHPVYYSDAELAVSREEAREKLGISGRMLLFFGFIRHYKGLDIAIEALTHLGPGFRDLMLWASGELWGGEEDRCRDIVNKYHLDDQVKIESGYLSESDLALRIAACDGVVLPYRSATGSGVLATAYAFDRPVIATRVGSLPDMVVDGKTGLLCDPGDARSLALAIQEFYAGKGPQRFEEDIQKAKREFTWDAIVNAVEELVENG